MSKTFNLKIITPNEIVFDKEVSELIVRAVDGEIGILPDHIPLITPLDIAPLKYKSNGEFKVAAVLGGMMEVSRDGVTIVSDHAALAENIDTVIAEREKELAELKLAQKKDKVDIQKAELDLTRLLVMLEAVELARKLKGKG